ncbi:MAG: hypothetical protein GWM88_00155 [Pseudomonadales bacterium]|nr:hypothetical protein [Pseudomonadales bacterium]NIX06510.1 hypothetical protein [Pseudomonadales bacterium]
MARLRRWSFAVLIVLSASASAREILVEGDVVRVIPLTASSVVVERDGDCAPVKPAGQADLVALLAWDLRADCLTRRREVQVQDGYRVYYRWDERVYSVVMSERPGPTIPLRINVR